MIWVTYETGVRRVLMTPHSSNSYRLNQRGDLSQLGEPYAVYAYDEPHHYGNSYYKAYETTNGLAESEMPVPTAKEGYTFVGWYSDPELTNPITEIPAGSKGDFVIYAKWVEN